MRKLLLFSALLLMTLPGCFVYYVKDPPTATEPSPVVTPTYYYSNITESEPANMVPVALPNMSNTTLMYSSSPKDANGIEMSMMNVNWVNPGKVTIENLHKGAEGDYLLRIHNGGANPTIFQVKPRLPDNLVNSLPWDCMNWIQLPEYSVYVPGKTTYEMPITVKMLTDIGMKGKTYEVWISVIDNSQKGMVQTELCSRLIISTRKY